jgi:Icc-related predicted phosphoesterase
VRRALSFLVVALLGAAAALLALGIDTVAKRSVGPGRVSLRAHLGAGRTELRLPPLGEISASTHRAPITLEAQVDEVDVDRLQALLTADEPGDLLRTEVSRDLEPLLRSFALRALLAAAVVGTLAGALVPRRRWTHALTGLAGGVVAVALLLGGAWRGFHEDAFREARFDGPLQRAPALLATVRRHVDGYADVRKRVEVLGDQVAELYAVATSEGSTTPAEGEVRILHVSDIHSNPLGLEVTRQLAERFKVQAVLDTGDLTSFGLPVEGRLGELVAQVAVPYLFVPGNHDSEANRAALGAVKNVQLLDGTMADVGGVRILGIADPTFTASNEIETVEADAIKRSRAPAVTDMVDAHSPDVLAVHDPVLGQASEGHVPLIVAGHVHESSAARRRGTLVLTVGSTGATGLGSFTVDTGRSYEAAVLRFVDRRLVSVDRVELRGVGGNFRVERTLTDPEDLDAPVAGQQVSDLPDPRGGDAVPSP